MLKRWGKINKAYRFQISHFYQSFSNDIVTVKGLNGLRSWLSDQQCIDLLTFGRFDLKSLTRKINKQRELISART